MKRITLLGSTALVGAGMMANPAMAADGIKLGLGGFFRTAYMATFDDDSEGELGNERNTDGVFSDAEIYFDGETTLDNGLTAGAHVELEGEQSTDQIDEAYVFFSGGFGEMRAGSQDDALAGSCLLPPGGTANFSAFSPNQWGANNDGLATTGNAAVGGVVGLTSNAACIGVDDNEDAQKLVYITPSFGGFQLALSYTPNGGDETHEEFGGPHIGMPINEDAESRHNFAAYATYTYEGDGWGLSAGGGGSFEGHVEQSNGAPDRDEQKFYQAALNLTFGQFAIGGVFEYYNNLLDQGSFINADGDLIGDHNVDAWVAGGGVAYTLDAWTLGAQYSHQDADDDGGDGVDFTMDRAVLTADYALGPGINLDGEVGYSWIDTSPEAGDNIDDYDALEIGIGTALTF
ncbi:porin [Dongia deserti]|uniref:porin n=1 Tax=Dongia deserti TaxID=2268030 RepID=UPI000E65EA23|nr:porin [Dongia deserti]